MTSGDQKPIVKFNTKAGKWKVDDVLLNSISFIVDMDNAEAGWMRFSENSAPDFRMMSVADLLDGAVFPPSPGENYRKGFRVQVKLPDRIAGGRPSIRELASNAFVVKRAFDSLFDQWFAGRAAHPGQLPIVQIKSYEEVSGKHGSNFAPVFTLVKWVDRPSDMPAGPQVAAVASEPAGIDDVDGFEDLDDEIPF